MDHNFVTIADKSNLQTASITASSATTDEIPFFEFAKGGYIVTAAVTAATLSYLGGDKSGGTFRPIYDSANAAKVQGISQDRAYNLPVECQGFQFLKIQADAGTATLLLSRKA